MSRSKKFYDIITFLISANIMGALAVSIFPFYITAYSADEFARTITTSVLLGLVAGLITAIAFTKFIPNAERGYVYTLFSGTFIALWTSLTAVVRSIEQQLPPSDPAFPLLSIFIGIGIFLWIMSMFAFAGVDLEK